jgi:UTP-glucose-1-phosphate uridylyltransferase
MKSNEINGHSGGTSAQVRQDPLRCPRCATPSPGGGGEAQLTDALREVIVHGGRVLAVPMPAGRRPHVIGSPKSYRAAFLEYALRDRRVGGSRRARAQLLDG